MPNSRKILRPFSIQFRTPEDSARSWYRGSESVGTRYGTRLEPWLKSQGAELATTQSLMRHANISVTRDRYVQAIGANKREAQSRIVRSLSFPNVPTRLTDSAATA